MLLLVVELRMGCSRLWRWLAEGLRFSLRIVKRLSYEISPEVGSCDRPLLGERSCHGDLAGAEVLSAAQDLAESATSAAQFHRHSAQ